MHSFPPGRCREAEAGGKRGCPHRVRSLAGPLAVAGAPDMAAAPALPASSGGLVGVGRALSGPELAPVPRGALGRSLVSRSGLGPIPACPPIGEGTFLCASGQLCGWWAALGWRRLVGLCAGTAGWCPICPVTTRVPVGPALAARLLLGALLAPTTASCRAAATRPA